MSELAGAVEAYRHRLEHLASEGRALRAALAGAPDSAPLQAAHANWQRECAATINGLSGGSKAHWLSRAYSESLLVPQAAPRPGSGQGESTGLTTIIDRVLGVLTRAEESLEHAEAAPSVEAPPPRARFTFIQDEALRASLERAYRDAQAAAAGGAHAVALVTFSSILEAVLTEALERKGIAQLATYELPKGPIAGWPFPARVTAAERARIISGGCARLPPAARTYRSLLDEHGEILPGIDVSARDAMRTGQVLNVILRDLAPGR